MSEVLSKPESICLPQRKGATVCVFFCRLVCNDRSLFNMLFCLYLHPGCAEYSLGVPDTDKRQFSLVGNTLSEIVSSQHIFSVTCLAISGT